MILAGAGSGKTRVLIHRIAYLLREGILPSHILAVTFTNKAANEMKERLQEMMGKSGKCVHLSTFHSLGVRILHETIEHIGYRRNFVIYDTHDQLALIRSVMEDEGLSDSPLIDPKGVHYAINQAKSAGIDAETFASDQSTPRTRLLGQVYLQYQKTLQGCNALDFEDILNLTLKLFENQPDVMKQIADRFRYVMVDEYQDTNRVQYRLLKHLAAGHRNLCVVGDDDQSIYGWRGAEPANMLGFERDFPDARLIRLEQNYRSTTVILEAANQLILNNTQRMPKQLWSEKQGGNPLEWIEAEDETTEMETVVRRLRMDVLRHGRRFSDYAVLYRSNYQSRVVEEALRDAGTPYRVVGGTSFFARQEIRDALAYLRVIHNPNDEVSLQRIINTPRRGIGKTSLMQLNECCRETGLPAFRIMKNATDFEKLPRDAACSMEAFASTIIDYRQRFKYETLGDTFHKLLDQLGFLRFLEQQKGDAKTRERRVSCVLELLSGSRKFSETHPNLSLQDYLVRMTMLSENTEDTGQTGNCVTLMTLHSAKGLEFPCVYMVGMAEGLFPNKRALEEEMEQEERRLCYVGMTRAQKELTFSMAKTRKYYRETVYQEPSRFLLEIDPDLFSIPVKGKANEKQAAVKRKRSRADFFLNLQHLQTGR